MVGRTCSVLSVMCWVLFQVTQARILEVQPAGWGGDLIRPTLPPQPPTNDNQEEETSHDQISLPKNRFDEISQGLYGGDIVLTQEQKRLLQERKATNPALFWPEDSNGNVIVGYRFGDTALIKHLKTPYCETITTPGTVSTPGYPTPIQNSMRFVKVLVAPYCYKVKLTVHDFEVYRRYTDGTCAIDALEVRTQDALGTGVKFCDKEITPGTVFISDNNTIVLEYYNYNYTSTTFTSPYRGFNATVEHIPVDGCTPTTTTPTTTTPTPAVTIINSGSIPVIFSSASGNCTLESANVTGYYRMMSPRYPSKYLPGDSCSVNIKTSEPRVIIVNATAIMTTAGDIINMTSAFGSKSSIDSKGTGKKYLLISSSSSNISFTPIAKTLGKTFQLGLRVFNSDCHQIIKVDAGANGTLSKTNYANNTICEWWIQAPIGMEIKLAFSTFNVGVPGYAGDFLGIATSGDRNYKTNIKAFCATNSPKTVTSSGSQMNVLLNGLRGGYPGFTATYSVV